MCVCVGAPVEAEEGAQRSHPGNTVHPPSISGQGGGALGREGGAVPGTPRLGGGKREGKSLPATSRGDTDTDTRTRIPPAPRPSFPRRSRKQPGGGGGVGGREAAFACAAPVARPQPGAPHRGVGAAAKPRSSRGEDGGTVSYLPAWCRGYLSMALGGAGKKKPGRSREPGNRERGRRRGARAGLAGAGSAGGAKPPGPPPPFHWSRALPIYRYRPGTLPVCEPPPGAGAAPHPLSPLPPGGGGRGPLRAARCRVPTTTSRGLAVHASSGALRPGGGVSPRDAVVHGVPRRIGIPPRGAGTPPPPAPAPRVHSPARCLRGAAPPAFAKPARPPSQHLGGDEAGRSCL